VNAALAPLSYPAYRRLTTGRTVTTLGNAIAPLALAFAVLDLTGSAIDLGLVVGARSLANVAFLVLGGVLADRLPRQWLLIGASVAAGLSQATVATLVVTGAASIPTLLGLSALNGAVSALAFPASAALTPQTVPASVRQQANALLRLASNTAMIVGSAVGGALVAAIGPGWGLATDAATFFLSAGAFALLRIGPVARSDSRAGFLADLRTGWGEFTARTWVWAIVVAFSLINMVFGAGQRILGPLVAEASIGRAYWGLVLAAETAGMLVGGLFALRWMPARALLAGMLWMLPSAALLLALGLTPHVAVLVPVALCSGFGIEQFAVAWETSVQQHIPADRLARVYSYDMLGSLIAVPLGQVVIGPVAGAVGTAPTLVGAALIAIAATLASLASRSVRTVRAQPTEPESVPV
jgi:MFS family permease